MLLKLRLDAAMFGVAFAAASGACGTVVMQPVDAGVDASYDAGVDAAYDAGVVRDASRDLAADTSVATLDAGRDPFWTPIPGSADGCVIEYARDPTAVYSPEWTTCPAHRR